jgi:hypothetical protein
MRTLRSLAAFALLAGLVWGGWGCGNSSTSSNPPAGYGTLQVSLTDGPIDLTQINNLFVTFDELYVVPNSDSLPPDSSATPIHVLSSPVTLDLLALSNGLTTVLGTAFLPDGDYRSINILLDEGNTWLIESDGDSFDVKVPSSRIKVIANFNVTAGQVTDLVLDFDAAASLIKTGNGTYILRPVIHQLPDRPVSAQISGTVFVQTDNGLVAAGDVIVPNPWLHSIGFDHGTGDRPGDEHGNGRGLDRRAEVPLTVAWPMIVRAAAIGDTTPGDDDGDDHAFSRGTLVDENGNYKLWRLRKDGTYELSLVLPPGSGYEVVSGPGTVTLDGDKTGQDFVIRAIVDTP